MIGSWQVSYDPVLRLRFAAFDICMSCMIASSNSLSCRWLADFEGDTHKKCVLHKARANRVKPLLPIVKGNEELYKQLQLDCGNALREITELKFEENRPFEKVQAPCLLKYPYSLLT